MKIVNNKENNGNNGYVKASNFKKTGEKKMPLLEDKNVNRPVAGVSGEETRSFLVLNGICETQKGNTEIVTNGCKSNSARKEMQTRKTPNYQEMHNGSGNSHPYYQESQSSLVVEIPKSRVDFVANGCKGNGARNEMATDEDFQPQEKDENLRKFLQLEASSFLRSCGWSDEVHSFMLEKKKRARDASSGGASPGNELKRMLIADAKSTFISRVPESLKSELIKHLKAFSQDTTHVDP